MERWSGEAERLSWARVWVGARLWKASDCDCVGAGPLILSCLSLGSDGQALYTAHDAGGTA